MKNKFSLEEITQKPTLLSVLKDTFKWITPIYGDIWIMNGLRNSEDKNKFNKGVFATLISIKYVFYSSTGCLIGMKLYQSDALDYVKKLIAG
jgi:hypothetical protein